ncbi:MAG: hypothetical protein KDG89_01585 [Geminicoccaceae bacterium]|nr:hypothetical protein [Geminicoccaceae bacterium]
MKGRGGFLDGPLPRLLAFAVFLACCAGIWLTLPGAAPSTGAGAGGDCLADATADIERRRGAGEIGAEQAMVLRQQAVGDCKGKG